MACSVAGGSTSRRPGAEDASDRAPLRGFRLTVEYDGTEYAGFQWQAEHRTIQGELEAAVGRLAKAEVRVTGAGRTDAGVHALGQVVSFRAATRMPAEAWAPAMNALLPRDIAVASASETEDGFSARYSARSRVYVYLLLNRPTRGALLDRYCWHWRDPLDVDAMREAGRRLLGTHDFAAWANSSDEVRSTVRTMVRCAVRPVGRFVVVMVEANAFLYGMVRNIVGTMVAVGRGRLTPDDMERITASRRRSEAGACAPARGLCLLRVRY
ncbi:MAG TPA: tRNA pseudouridine(38-40) synthase TruA [Chthonomonadales bacterium]|nr:tRNA pseudouridine(38-40) synthase TruA [Chthonomonadales bacterium]